MSIDLFLRCKTKPSVKKLEAVIFPLGWKKKDHIHLKGERSYYWFQSENFMSIRGCWLFVRKPDEEDPKGTKVVFHSYSNAARSHEDLEAQNEVIRALRKEFGGSLYDPQANRASYLHNDIPKLSPGEKACGFVYINFQRNLSRAFEIIDEHEVLRNNVTIPFLIACFESFLKEFFIAYLETHPDVQEKVYEKTSKITYGEVRALLKHEKTLAEVEADNYSFQNLDSANHAYKTYIDIDIYALLNERRRVGKTSRVVREVVQELLELRHEIVHAAHIDQYLDKGRMEIYIGYLRKAGQLFVDKFLVEKDFRIDLEEYV